MKSPFPGMDPYIEGCGLWEDFHHALIEDIKNALSENVPERYAVRTGERCYVVLAESQEEKKHSFKPDVGVTAAGAEPIVSSSGGTAVAEAVDALPLTMRAFVTTEYQETFIEIYTDEPQRRLVTSIEVLSPTNKRRGTPGWDLFLRERRGLLLGTANVVEIDLLRGGERMPMLDPWPNSPYTLLVARKLFAPSCKVWRAHYRHPLPAIPVPLAHPDPDVWLRLQPMVETIYSRSRYHRSIDYSRGLDPPLPPDDATWLEQEVRKQASA